MSRIIKPFTQEEKESIINLYKEGYAPGKICKKIKSLNNRKSQVLYPILIKAGLYKKKPADDRRRFKVDDHFFDKIDNERKAYWLGFMLADGFLSNSGHATESFGISLAIEDKYILEEFKKDLDSTYEVKEYIGKSTFDGISKDFHYAKILIKSKLIFNKLKEYGFTTTKSYDGIVPENHIPEDLRNHFIRGYFDGNGGFSKGSGYHLYTLDFTGTKEIMEWILKVFNKTNLKLHQRYPERNNNNYSIRISGDKQVYELGKYLYQNSTIFLKRKYDKFLIIENKYKK